MGHESARNSDAVAARRSDLARALEREEFFLVYQPELDLRTGAFSGVEALVRWRHGDEVLAPVDFVADLDETGDITAVGRWILATACRQGARWRDRGYRFSVSVNVSERQLENGGLLGDVEDALAASGFEPASLDLEFAERVARDRVHVDALNSLYALGVRLAVDDFRPGSSSLEALAAAHVSVVKLDRGAVAALSGDASLAALRAVVAEARTRQIEVVASGLEESEQRRQLQLEEVSTGQGYLFAKPYEAHDLDRFLEDFSIFSGKPL